MRRTGIDPFYRYSLPASNPNSISCVAAFRLENIVKTNQIHIIASAVLRNFEQIRATSKPDSIAKS